MRIVLVHGINNENNSPRDVEDIWMGALRETWTKSGLGMPKGLEEIAVAYYATELAELTRTAKGVVTAGPGVAPSMTQTELLEEYAQSIGITRGDVVASAQELGLDISAVEAGVPHEGWIIALGRALENALPHRGRYLVRMFLRQASIYIDRKGVQTRIKAIVRNKLVEDGGRAVIVAHSLGTVISYELLTEESAASWDVPLFCTLGSPLAVAIFTNYVGKKASFPKPPVQSWLNGLHKNDFVTLGRSLDSVRMGFEGIDNDDTIINDGDDKHEICAYLSTPSIAAAIHNALGEK